MQKAEAPSEPFGLYGYERSWNNPCFVCGKCGVVEPHSHEGQKDWRDWHMGMVFQGIVKTQESGLKVVSWFEQLGSQAGLEKE